MREGRLWPVVLVATLVSPVVAWRVKKKKA